MIKCRHLRKVNLAVFVSVIYIYERSLSIKIGVEQVNQANKLTRTEVNNNFDFAVNCVQIAEQMLRQGLRSALYTPYREYDVKVLQN